VPRLGGIRSVILLIVLLELVEILKYSIVNLQSSIPACPGWEFNPAKHLQIMQKS